MLAMQEVITHCESQSDPEIVAALALMDAVDRIAFTHTILLQLSMTNGGTAEACQLAVWILSGKRKW